MPVTHNIKIKHISEDDFRALDYKVMELIFSIHKDMGRFWNENIYQNELAFRCRDIGFTEIATEIPIKVSFEDFQKFYYIDLLINNGVIYELKTAKQLTGEHKNQTLNYLFLMGLHYGKLVNLRPQSVDYSFVSTNITTKKRYEFSIDDREWKQLDSDSLWLKQLIIDLLNEWGVFLDTDLFLDAIMHFRGGENNVAKSIEVVNNQRDALGTQKVHLLNLKTAFRISSMTKDDIYYEQHLYRFIRYTPLKAIQWINFNRDKIVFKTISR